MTASIYPRLWPAPSEDDGPGENAEPAIGFLFLEYVTFTGLLMTS